MKIDMRKTNKIMYELEHKLVPKCLFEDPQGLLENLFNKEDYLFNTIKDMAIDEKMAYLPFIATSFGVSGGKISEDSDLLAIRIDYPHPDESPLCYCAYIISDPEFKNPAYFTIQLNVSKHSDNPVIVMHTPDGQHINLGESSFEDHQEYFDCIKHYKVG